MFKKLAILLACSTLAACATAPSGKAHAEKLAENYISSRAELRTDPYKARFVREDYLSGFKHAFLAPHHKLASGPEVSFAAEAAGRDYRRKHPQKFEQTMADYGYQHYDEVGSWVQAFEISSFDPGDRRKIGGWLNILGDSPAERFKRPEAGCRTLRVMGYISPKGTYGHLGMYAWEIYASEVRCID